MSQSKKRDYLDQISPNCNHFNSRIWSKKPTYKNKSWYTKKVDRGQNEQMTDNNASKESFAKLKELNDQEAQYLR